MFRLKEILEVENPYFFWNLEFKDFGILKNWGISSAG
jgi:hypothetical protein